MISHDQPTIFGDQLIVAVSSVDDGVMNFKSHDIEEVRGNRLAFLERAGVDPTGATLVQVTYEDTTDFARYKIVGDEHAGEGIFAPESGTEADALVAVRPEQALFLPLADCIGAVIFDPVNGILMMSHLGRHSLEQAGGKKSVEYLLSEFGSRSSDLLVWLSPAAGKAQYPLHALGGKGLHEAALEQMIQAGVDPGNIEASRVNTADSPDYFSHSEFLKGDQPGDGRFAIVAMMAE